MTEVKENHVWMLSDLLGGLARVSAAMDRRIGGLSLDSRSVRPGDLFFACAGHQRHGLIYVWDAIARGAAAVIYETPLADGCEKVLQELRSSITVPLIGVDRLSRKTGEIASRFFADPSLNMLVVGITGTNGKTSCSHFLAQALTEGDTLCGVIGTLGYGVYGQLQTASHTTPDAVTLQRLLAELRDSGVRQVVMEVSSHALAQERTRGVRFDAAIFTNLTHDHLDYHSDLRAYGLEKSKLFRGGGSRFSIINRDDAFGPELAAMLPESATLVEYGLSDHGAEGPTLQTSARVHKFVVGEVLDRNLGGFTLRISSTWGCGNLHTSLLGAFSAQNLLAVAALLLALDFSLSEVIGRLARVGQVPGRMERFGGERNQPLVIVDYAHTPDALHKVLCTLRDHCGGLLWCVFGCGGDRDRAKRPLMGTIAVECADRVIVTSDNPRTESVQSIIGDILRGIDARYSVEVIEDRAQAINHAVHQAKAADIVLIAGKGHEDYQIVGDSKLHFSDREQVMSVLKDVA